MKRDELIRAALWLLIAFGILFLARSCVAAARAGDIPSNYRTPDRVLASVRIGAAGGCSGTIIRRDGRLAWGISAAHCASRTDQEFTFATCDGSNAQARWAAIDRQRDLSLFVCWSRDTLAAAKICSDLTPDWSQEPTVEAVGYPSRVGPKWKCFAYRSTGVIRERGSRRHFVRNQFANQGPGAFAPGDSGGGVFLDGYLVGVMTHSGPNVATHRQIVEFLQDNAAKFGGVDPFRNCRDGRCQLRPGWLRPNIPIIPKPDVDEARIALQNRIKTLETDLAARTREVKDNVAKWKADRKKLDEAADKIAALSAELKQRPAAVAAEVSHEPAAPSKPNWLLYGVLAVIGVGALLYFL